MWRQYESEGSLKFGIRASEVAVSASLLRTTRLVPFWCFLQPGTIGKVRPFFTVTTSFHGSVACVCQEPDQDLLETL